MCEQCVGRMRCTFNKKIHRAFCGREKTGAVSSAYFRRHAQPTNRSDIQSRVYSMFLQTLDERGIRLSLLGGNNKIPKPARSGRNSTFGKANGQPWRLLVVQKSTTTSRYLPVQSCLKIESNWQDLRPFYSGYPLVEKVPINEICVYPANRITRRQL
jgi:hypothetical protein